jgi:hypothetical protein
MGNLKTFIVIFLSCLALSGCVTNENNRSSRAISDYPEAQLHATCLEQRATEFAGMQGNTIDLAYVAASGCRTTRERLARALSNSRVFVDTFVENGTETDTQLVAEMIYRIRSGN